MAELRWNPLIQDWIIIASHRQDRPQMPKDWCPFCPGNGKVPDHFDVLRYDNDFPALSQDPPDPDPVGTDFFLTRRAYGKCEVILYSSDHNAILSQLPISHIRKLVDLWVERTEELAKDPGIRYVFVFENRGEVVGVTMPHPHGQIYGYSHLPKKIQLELAAFREYRDERGTCLLCELNASEQAFQKRMVFENRHFMVYLPFFAEYPYGIYLVSKAHKPGLSHFTGEEKTALAEAIRDTVGLLDALFAKPFPYMLCMHQEPVNGDCGDGLWHFHIEFFPPMRSGEKQKYNASSETGVWAHCNPTSPEEKAEELRTAYRTFRERG